MTPEDKQRLLRLYGTHRAEEIKRAALWGGLSVACFMGFLASLLQISHAVHFAWPSIFFLTATAWVCSRAVDSISAARELSEDIRRESNAQGLTSDEGEF